MWWPFKQSDDAKAQKLKEQQYQQYCEQSIKALERGEILPRAKERIQEQLSRQNPLWSSDLSVNEFLLAKESGLEVLGQVMGSSFYKIGWTQMNNRRTGEIWEVSEAHRQARSMAVLRMKKEAELFGADGVIGVKLKADEQISGMIEFTAIGTAVKIPGWSDAERVDAPFVSEMNAQEFWQLLQAGYRPVNIVFGICSYYINTDTSTYNTLQTGIFNWVGNQEVHQYTRGFYTAREMAIGRICSDIEQWKAHGCVGMTITPHMHEVEYEINDTKYRDLLVTFAAVGTSIKKLSSPPPAKERKPLTVLNLSTKKYSNIGNSRLSELSGSVIDEGSDFGDDDE